MKDKGLLFEEEFFGCDSRHKAKRWNLGFAEGVAYARDIQSTHFRWDPKNPSTDLAQELFHNVRKELPSTLQHELCLYVALGTSLDTDFGTDGFFQIDHMPAIATIDLKTGKKIRSPKAGSIIIHQHDFEDKTLLDTKTRLIAGKVRRIDPRLDIGFPYTLRMLLVFLAARENDFIERRSAHLLTYEETRLDLG